MARRFSHFVILADMRTGSNLLEERLSGLLRVSCHGELFNPVFVGRKGCGAAFGITLTEREKRPDALVESMIAGSGDLPGFRFFPDHDARIEDHILRDRDCAKIVLTRNPLEAYVSLKAARETGQWRTNGDRPARKAIVKFDAVEFEEHLQRQRDFYDRARRMLQITGQAAFQVTYGDLRDDKVIAGIGRFLGVGQREPPMPPSIRAQNSEPLSERVANPGDMMAAIGQLDLLDAGAIPDREPGRGANVTRWQVIDEPATIYMPLPGGPNERVARWLGETSPGGARSGLTRKELRQWKRRHPGHRGFTVVTHPLARAHRAFARHIVAAGPERFDKIRRVLEDRWSVDLRDERMKDDAGYGEAFRGFLRFLKANLGGQTAARTPAVWASQEVLLRGISDFSTPDLVLREEDLAGGSTIGLGRPPPATVADEEDDKRLRATMDRDIEAAAKSAYQRDYMAFGFGPFGS